MSSTKLYEDAVGAADRADFVDAARLWRRAAEQGHAKAQYNLGVAYARGRGVPADAAEALKWWRQAAEQGHAAAIRQVKLVSTERVDGDGFVGERTLTKVLRKHAEDTYPRVWMVFVIFCVLGIPILLLATGAWFVPNFWGYIYFGLFAFVAIVAIAALIRVVIGWARKEASLLIRLDEAGPKKICAERNLALRSAFDSTIKILLIWTVALAATWTLNFLLVAALDDLNPRYNVITGLRMPPADTPNWFFFPILLFVALILRGAGAKHWWTGGKSD